MDIIRILSYNILHGEGLDGKIDLGRAARVILQLDPDVACLQEIDKGTRRTGRVDQMLELGQLTHMHHVFGKFMDYAGGGYGMGVLSKRPIQEAINHPLPPGTEPRSALAARIGFQEAGQEMLFVGIHLYETAQERLAQAQKLVALFKNETVPVILAGDFNSEPDSQVISFLKEHWEVPSKGDDPRTWPSDHPQVEIDYIMYRPADRFAVAEYRVIQEALVSDHRPILLELKLTSRS
jgi:endonuclease/exonuclease/phosphatase family metal-dependent hydrolase